MNDNLMIEPIKLRIFLCHSSGDKPVVRTLFRKLQSDGFDPWLDEENLIAGQDWQLEIPNAVRKADVVLVCLSCDSITKTGYVQKEIKYALDVADEQPDGAIFIIPVRLEECDVPQRLQRWHWVNYFEVKGYKQLLRSLSIVQSAIKKRLSLGIMGQEIHDPVQDKDLPIGIYIAKVNQKSSAAKAGIRKGDVLISLADKAITSMKELDDIKKNFRVGDIVKVVIVRKRKIYNLKFTFE